MCNVPCRKQLLLIFYVICAVTLMSLLSVNLTQLFTGRQTFSTLRHSITRTFSPVGTEGSLPNSASDRRSLVSTVCHRSQPSPKNVNILRKNPMAYDHLLVDERNKVLYCYVPKAGCSSWKFMFTPPSKQITLENLYQDKERVHVPGMQTHLSEFSLAEIKQKLATYTKFLVTRNPFSRIYSGYKDKFLREYWHGTSVYRDLIRSMYPEITPDAGKMFVPFDKFLKMLVHAKTSNVSIILKHDEHWREISALCHPCAIDYDIIAHLETMDQDKEPILKLLNKTEVPHANADEKTGNIFGFDPPPLEEAYATLPVKTLIDFIDVYQLDFDLFGYSKSIFNRTI